MFSASPNGNNSEFEELLQSILDSEESLRELEERILQNENTFLEERLQFEEVRLPQRSRIIYVAFHRALRKFHSNCQANSFPSILPSRCSLTDCEKNELLAYCHHDLEYVLWQSGQDSEAFLKQERLLWHPDKFSGKGDGPLRVTEVFKMIQALLDEAS
jgi:hypothetical protein